MLELWARGFAEYFISTCVGEMPPSDTGTDNLAHLQKARQLRVCAYEHRLHCAVVWAASIKTILCLYSTSVFYWGLLAQYKSVVSNKILILLFQQSQFFLSLSSCWTCKLPRTYCMMCFTNKCCPTVELKLWTPQYLHTASHLNAATRLESLEYLHLRLAYEWDTELCNHEGGMRGEHGRRNAAGHKAITPTPKIIHRGQSSFTASFLDKNKRRGFGFCGGDSGKGRNGVA